MNKQSPPNLDLTSEREKQDTSTPSLCAINCNVAHTNKDLPESVMSFLNNSLSDNTKRSYRADMAHYEASGRHLPSQPEAIASYIAEMAHVYAASTIQRHLASIAKAHCTHGFEDPCKTEIVRATLQGIKRTIGTSQRRAKPVVTCDLFLMLDHIDQHRAKDIRDRAILLLGFATAMRRSELAMLDVQDIEFEPRGAIITIKRSKTDQEGRSRKIAVPFGRTRHCPILALKSWLEYVHRVTGPLFVRINKHNQLSDQRISGEAINLVLKERLEDAAIDPKYFSAHSLRAGFATSAANAGAPTHKIKEVTGHKSDSVLARYIRDGDLLLNHAVSQIL